MKDLGLGECLRAETGHRGLNINYHQHEFLAFKVSNYLLKFYFYVYVSKAAKVSKQIHHYIGKKFRIIN